MINGTYDVNAWLQNIRIARATMEGTNGHTKLAVRVRYDKRRRSLLAHDVERALLDLFDGAIEFGGRSIPVRYLSHRACCTACSSVMLLSRGNDE